MQGFTHRKLPAFEPYTTPVLTGERAVGIEEGFSGLIDNYAVAHGIATAPHRPGSPVGPVAMGFRREGPWPHFDEEGKWCNCVTY
jgi:hypothetical protein